MGVRHIHRGHLKDQRAIVSRNVSLDDLPFPHSHTSPLPAPSLHLLLSHIIVTLTTLSLLIGVANFVARLNFKCLFVYLFI